jgi:hypothetical protein
MQPARGDERITYTNQTGTTLNELVLAVEPNEGGFTLENILMDGISLPMTWRARLTVHPPQPLAPNAQAALAMRFRISIAKTKEHPYGYDVDRST